jgi:hypothetical protein
MRPFAAQFFSAKLGRGTASVRFSGSSALIHLQLEGGAAPLRYAVGTGELSRLGIDQYEAGELAARLALAQAQKSGAGMQSLVDDRPQALDLRAAPWIGDFNQG